MKRWKSLWSRGHSMCKGMAVRGESAVQGLTTKTSPLGYPQTWPQASQPHPDPALSPSNLPPSHSVASPQGPGQKPGEASVSFLPLHCISYQGLPNLSPRSLIHPLLPAPPHQGSDGDLPLQRYHCNCIIRSFNRY